MKAQPRITVIMCTYRGERFLADTIRSVLNQSYANFEFIIVNDGSDDGSDRVLSDFKDPRIILINNAENLGYAASLNKACAVAAGMYIAIQEHDDLSLPDRFEVQLAYLDSHKETAFVGSSAIVIDENGDHIGIEKVPSRDIDLKWTMLWGQTVFHSVVMFRRSALEAIGPYSESARHLCAPDYELMSRFIRKYPGANLETPLFKWRRHSQTLSSLNRVIQDQQGYSIAQRNIQDVMNTGELTPDVWEGLRRFLLSNAKTTIDLRGDEVRNVISFLRLLLKRFHARYGISFRERLSHKTQLYSTWSKHCLALAYRRNGKRNAFCRLILCAEGLLLICQTLLPARSK